jgi:hypothetical protein
MVPAVNVQLACPDPSVVLEAGISSDPKAVELSVTLTMALGIATDSFFAVTKIVDWWATTTHTGLLVIEDD